MRAESKFVVLALVLTSARSSINPDPELRLSPERGNVAFASTDMGWCFTLRSFAQMYADTYGEMMKRSPLPQFLTKCDR